MSQRFRVRRIFLASAVIGALTSEAAAQATLPPLYQWLDLRAYSAARLGTGGRLVGARIDGLNDFQAAIFENGEWHDLGKLPGDTGAVLLGVNPSGEAVGYSSGTVNRFNHDYYRSRTIQATTATGLTAVSGINPGLDPEVAQDYAQAINDQGVMVGCRTKITCENHFCDYVYVNPTAFLRQTSGQVVAPLGSSTDRSCAVDINNSNTAVGYALENGPTGSVQKGFRYSQAGDLTWLETPTARLSQARGINEAGDIVGNGRPKDPQVYWDHAYVLTAAGELRDLGVAGLGATQSSGADINEAGDVVGYFELPGNIRGFVGRGGNVFDLNEAVDLTPGWTVQSAHDIDDDGRILASVAIPVTPPTSPPTYEYTTVLLTPTNRPPTSELEQAFSVDEGGALPLAGATADDEPATLQHDWAIVDGPGAIESQSGPNATFSAAGVDGMPGSAATVRLTVTDASGATASAEAVVQVVNLPPTATFSAMPGSVYPGEVAIVSFTGAVDPSPADTAAGFGYSFSCSVGLPLSIASQTPSYPCQYVQPGEAVVQGQIVDKDGGVRSYSVTVTVLSHQEGIAGLIQMVQALETSGVLDAKDTKYLFGKLDGAVKQLDKGNVGPAVNQLESFVKKVEALVETGDLSPADGQPLIDGARRIIAGLA